MIGATVSSQHYDQILARI